MPLKNPPLENAPHWTAPGGVNKRRFFDGLLFCALLLWTYLSLCFPQWDTDFWWHLKTGEWMLENGYLPPQVDLYTFTEFGAPWIDLHWGFQHLITFLYHLGGADLVILVKAAIITAAVAVAWSAGGQNLPVWIKTAVWILPVVCIAGRGYERPEMLSQLFLAAWLWMARRVEERPRLIWLLPLLQVAWVNCHALFVLGLLVGGCYAADCVARDIAHGRWGLAPPASKPAGRHIVCAGLLVIAAGFVNPYFEEGALYPLTLYRYFSVDQEFYSSIIGELRRPFDIVMTEGWLAALHPYLFAELGTWFLLSASFVWLVLRRRRWSVLRLLLFVGFSNLAWEAIRNANIVALVAGFIICENFGEALATERPATLSPSAQRGAWGTLAVLAGLSVAVVSGWWGEVVNKYKPFGLGEFPRAFMHEAARFAGRDGFPRRAFVSHIGQAAVYIYHNAPERRVFMDPRTDVCSRKTFEEFFQIRDLMIDGNPDWQEFFREKEGELPAVLLDIRVSLPAIRGMLATPGWRLVYSDETGTVFLSDSQADKLALFRVPLAPVLEEKLREVEQKIEEHRRQEQRLDAFHPPGATVEDRG